jgi:hypothetical protein
MAIEQMLQTSVLALVETSSREHRPMAQLDEHELASFLEGVEASDDEHRYEVNEKPCEAPHPRWWPESHEDCDGDAREQNEDAVEAGHGAIPEFGAVLVQFISRSPGLIARPRISTVTPSGTSRVSIAVEGCAAAKVDLTTSLSM